MCGTEVICTGVGWVWLATPTKHTVLSSMQCQDVIAFLQYQAGFINTENYSLVSSCNNQICKCGGRKGGFTELGSALVLCPFIERYLGMRLDSAHIHHPQGARCFSRMWGENVYRGLK